MKKRFIIFRITELGLPWDYIRPIECYRLSDWQESTNMRFWPRIGRAR